MLNCELILVLALDSFHLRLGSAVQVAEGKTGPSKMQTKTPGMFSLNSMAYWLNCAPNHLAAVPCIKLSCKTTELVIFSTLSQEFLSLSCS